MSKTEPPPTTTGNATTSSSAGNVVTNTPIRGIQQAMGLDLKVNIKRITGRGIAKGGRIITLLPTWISRAMTTK